KGADASDTIERTPSFEHNSQRSKGSDMLLDMEFCSPVQLQVILQILRAIHSRPKTRTYTVHRYNCYFFARAIVLCIARSVRKSHSGDLKSGEPPYIEEFLRVDREGIDTVSEYYDPIQESKDKFHRQFSKILTPFSSKFQAEHLDTRSFCNPQECV
ncbi:unnamed protein product, partial [Rhizoctonia solani]